MWATAEQITEKEKMFKIRVETPEIQIGGGAGIATFAVSKDAVHGNAPRDLVQKCGEMSQNPAIMHQFVRDAAKLVIKKQIAGRTQGIHIKRRTGLSEIRIPGPNVNKNLRMRCRKPK